MTYKLIAIDIDGTLLRSDKTISQKTIDTLHEASAAGIKIVLCTGRPTSGTNEVLETLNLDPSDAYVITYHGAVTTKLDTREKAFDHSILTAEVKTLFDFADELGAQAFAINDEGMDTTSETLSELAGVESKIMNIPINKLTEADFKADKSYSKFMFIDSPEMVDKVERHLPSQWHDTYTILRS